MLPGHVKKPMPLGLGALLLESADTCDIRLLVSFLRPGNLFLPLLARQSSGITDMLVILSLSCMVCSPFEKADATMQD